MLRLRSRQSAELTLLMSPRLAREKPKRDSGLPVRRTVKLSLRRLDAEFR